MGQNKDQESHDVLMQPNSTNVGLSKCDGLSLKDNAPEKKHKCPYSGCNAVFLRPSRLERHIRLHTGEKPYKCSYPKCDKAYTNSSHLKRHVESHNIIKQTYQCPVCLLSISNRHNLKRHYDRAHGENSKLICKDCDLTFTKKQKLKAHCAVYHPQIQKCEKCNKVFTDVRKFKRHAASHEGQTKPYPCTVAGCTEIFGKWRLLCAHLKTQHVIDYKCEHCGRVFLSKSHLKIHAEVHAENRPVIPCPYEKCHRVYYFKRNLDQHIRTNHLGHMFECDICKVKIMSKQKLAEHIQKLHMSEKRVKKIKKLNRKKRKDAGKPKKSVVSAFIGITLPLEMEKQLLQRKSNISYFDDSKSALNCVESF